MDPQPDLTPQEIQTLARGAGLSIPPGDLAEVTHRYTALLEQLHKLDALDLSGVEPTAVFPNPEA